MAGRYKSYSDHKDSGVEWLGSIPNHWDVKKLKFLAYIQPSNVDKKTSKNETPVLLCNYTDVYYNETVHADMDFMKASATEDQIEKFTLKSGDIIITKDSEDPNDIAIPTFVPESMPGVVCGYHLSIIRPQSTIYGLYIKRVFECGYARAYFSTRSNGLTRYGLGTHALANVFYPKPPEKEAENIANFLDHETAKIDTLIEKQQQLIQLLKEKRQAVISHAVTKGLNPNAKMRDSGLEWLREVPEHWGISQVGHCAFVTKLTGFEYTKLWATSEDGEIIALRGFNIKERGLDLYQTEKISLDLSNTLARSKLSMGDIVFPCTGTIGSAALIDSDNKFHINQNIAKISFTKEISPRFAVYWLTSSFIRKLIERNNMSGMQPVVLIGDIRELPIPRMNIDEQNLIADFLDAQVTKFNRVIDSAENATGLMQERRAALISAAVTGKIDVRDWIAPQARQTNKEVAA